jgi:RHO protein GDP dissociation inhibitor
MFKVPTALMRFPFSYNAKAKFVDDDKVVHLEFSFPLKIAKDW